MSNLSHIILISLLYYVFYLLSKFKQNTINRNYYSYCFPLIFLYSTILGLRYNWGLDYLWYKDRFEFPHLYDNEDFGFQNLNIFLNDLGFNYIGAFIFYSFLFILCAFILIKNYKENKYMFVFFVTATLIFSTSAIRQALAHSFLFLIIYFIDKRKWILIPVMLYLMYSIHPASLLTAIAVIFSFLFLSKQTIPPTISVPLYVIISLSSTYLSLKVSSIFDQIIPMIGFMGNKFDSYFLNSEKWFGESAIDPERIQSVPALILSILFNSATIYIGYISLKYKPDKNIIYIYNLTIIGIFLFRLFLFFEILKRIAIPIQMLYFIPLGYSFSFFFKNIKAVTKKEKKFFTYSIAIVILYLVLYHGRFILLSPECIYIWNK